jgi:hypothetical protein
VLERAGHRPATTAQLKNDIAGLKAIDPPLAGIGINRHPYQDGTLVQTCTATALDEVLSAIRPLPSHLVVRPRVMNRAVLLSILCACGNSSGGDKPAVDPTEPKDVSKMGLVVDAPKSWTVREEDFGGSPRIAVGASPRGVYINASGWQDLSYHYHTFCNGAFEKGIEEETPSGLRFIQCKKKLNILGQEVDGTHVSALIKVNDDTYRCYADVPDGRDPAAEVAACRSMRKK